MFQLGQKVVLLLLLVAVSTSLKPSQAGVNDWAINTLGEVRELTFVKNKIYFLSQLNSIGILDKYSGSVEVRSQMAESEKIVGFGEMTMNIVTRYNQVVSHFITATGLDKKTSTNFKATNKTVQWLTRFDQNQFFITKTSLHHGQELIREAGSDETYLRVIQDKTTKGNTLYLLFKNTKEEKYCIESYIDAFVNKHCFQSSEKVFDFSFYEGHIILALSDSTFLLSQSLQLVVSFNQRLYQQANGALLLSTKAYNIATLQYMERRPVKTPRKDVSISMVQDGTMIIVYRENDEIFSIKGIKNTPIKAWLNFKSEVDYDMIIQYTDLQLVCYTISKGDVQVSWKREQSLAYVKDTLFMKYHELDTLDNEYHRHLIQHSYRDLSLMQKLSTVPSDLFRRILEELADIKHFAFQSMHYLIDIFSNIDKTSIRKFEMPAQQEIKYGLRKYLLIATQYNTVIAIDTKTHDFLWKIDRNTNSQIIQFVHLKRDYETQVAILVSYSQSSASTYIQEITENGEIKLLATFNSKHEPFIYKINAHNIAIKLGDKIQKYCLFKEDDLAEKQFYFYTQDSFNINGWKAVGDSVLKIWNFQTQGSEHIINVASAFRGEQTALIPLFDREKVFFKNVDFTNLAVLTSFNRTDVALYIINGRTGKVHYNSFKNSVNINLPINLVYDQNNVLVSYFNHKSKNFEIWTVQQYQQRIETSAISMISDYLYGNTYKPQQSREKTIFEEQVYGSPVYIKVMEVSESKMSLTRRNLFIITQENKLYTINRDLVSTRRPKKDAKSFFANEKYPEYAYFLPYLPASYLSYSLNLATMNKIVFSPTDMESTIFTLCYGSDLFMIRNAPDKTFDMITEDFNHVVLILILVAATIGILFFIRILNAAKIKRPHIE